MIWTLIHIIDLMLWLFIAGSVMYVFFFALVATFHRKKRNITVKRQPPINNRFAILFPAYHEDAVIKTSIDNILRQDYPKDLYDVIVVSDHMSEETNTWLKSRPLIVFTPQFEISSKARSMQYAISNLDKDYNYIVILDADNIVEEKFLIQLNEVCNQGYRAIQCHRCAKNHDNDIAILDGISEEINNTIFRRAHNYIGLSSALIGSGMCFSYQWFKDNVDKLSTAGEDRELEVLLIEQNIHIRYEENVPVYDEKVSNADNFQRQRLRWMTAQIQCLLIMLPHTLAAIKDKNINFVDKTIQQALIPRSILIVITLLMAIGMNVFINAWGTKWLILAFILCASVVLSIPPYMRKQSFLRKVVRLPSLTWKMLLNLRKIDKKSTDFIHTEHKDKCV